MKKFYLLFSLLALPALALANTGAPDPAFLEFAQAFMDWSSGALATGLCTTMLIMGMVTGVAKNSPMPTLTGVAVASFLKFMPGVILNLTGLPAQPPTVLPAQAAQMLVATTKATSSTISANTSAIQASSALKDKASLKAKVAAAADLTVEVPKITPAAASPTLSSNQPEPETDKKTLTSAASLPHTVPVPVATTAHMTLKAPAVSSSQVTRWVGIGGAMIILTLLGLLMYLSAQRRARASAGFNPGSSTVAPTPASAFSDPHGFQREKRSPTFGHESA